jgi:hypothetical protein
MMFPTLALASTLLFCAPGYPGAPEDAQPLLDTFAQAAVANAHWPKGSLTTLYDPTEEGGLAKLADSSTALAFVPYPFYVAHAAAVHLSPLLQADVTGIGTEERWTLIVPRGRVANPAAMNGYTLASIAGYAPGFVRDVALARWPLPPSVKIVASGQVLTLLRRIAAGEPLAMLLDQEESGALDTLPFAGQLARAAESAPLPVAILAVVDSRLPAAQAQSLRAALLSLPHAPGGADALAGLRLSAFAPLKLPASASTP